MTFSIDGGHGDLLIKKWRVLGASPTDIQFYQMLLPISPPMGHRANLIRFWICEKKKGKKKNMKKTTYGLPWGFWGDGMSDLIIDR